MMQGKQYLIMQDEDISVYNEALIDYVPSNMKIGGYITAINNHNHESRWKEWKWYRHEDGTMFNDKDYVIDMLSNFVKRL
jgi:hypothetical protein